MKEQPKTPKLQTYEFDNGRVFLDAWAADGKPMLSGKFIGKFRAMGVACAVVSVPIVLFWDWGPDENVFSPFQRGVAHWWSTFVALDKWEVAKARSVKSRRPATPQADDSDSFWTWDYRKRKRPDDEEEAVEQLMRGFGIGSLFNYLKGAQALLRGERAEPKPKS